MYTNNTLHASKVKCEEDYATVVLDQAIQISDGSWPKFREFSMNVVSLLMFYVKREIHEGQFSPFFVILSDELVNFIVISHEIAEIAWIERKQEFTNKELKWNLFPWNAENYIRIWIFRKCEFTDL